MLLMRLLLLQHLLRILRIFYHLKIFLLLPEQLQFFSDAATVERKEKLETVIEEIRGRFGKYAIQPACLCQDIKMPTDREVELRMPTGMIG